MILLHEIINTTCSVEKAVTKLAVGDKYMVGFLLLSKDGDRLYTLCDIASLDRLINIQGWNVEEHSFNALHIAAMHGQVEIMKMLLDHKVDVNSKDVNDNTALHHAAGAGCLDTNMKLKLIDEEDDTGTVYVKIKYKYILVEKTFSENFEIKDIINILVEYSASVIEQNSDGNTALHVAAALGHVTIAKLLLEHNASAVTADELQDTAARSAAERNHRKTEQQDSGESDSTKDADLIPNKSLLEVINEEGQTALLHAASKGCLEGVKFLIEEGASYTIRDIYNDPWLMLILKILGKMRNDCYSSGEVENRDLPVSRSTHRIPFEDVDINAKGNEGKTVLMIATENNNQYVVKKLIDLGADVNATDDVNESTALHFALRNYKIVDTSVLEALICGGACVNATDFNGDKPIHTAVDNESTAAVDWLMSNGAVLRERNKEGEKILDLAINDQLWHVVENLMTAVKSERVKSRVSWKHHVADHLDCIDCLDRLKECSSDLGSSVTQIKQVCKHFPSFKEQYNMSGNYLIRKHEQIFRNYGGLTGHSYCICEFCSTHTKMHLWEAVINTDDINISEDRDERDRTVLHLLIVCLFKNRHLVKDSAARDIIDKVISKLELVNQNLNDSRYKDHFSIYLFIYLFINK